MIKSLQIILFLLFFSEIVNSQSMISKRVELVSEKNIFPTGTFNACHASTIVEIENGKFLAAWFAGSYEGANDVGIWISTFVNNSWSDPIELLTGKDKNGNSLPCWNPVLFKTSENKLILFYKVGKDPRKWWGMFVISYDNGKTWSDPVKLPAGFLGPIKNKPIQISGERIFYPSSVELENGDWSSHIEISDTSLTNWIKVEIPKDDSIGVIQPTLLVHKILQLQALCRSKQNYIYSSLSNDSGKTWSKLTPLQVPNPNSGIDAVRSSDDEYLLVYNPLFHGKDWVEGRNVLNVALSEDGIIWNDVYQLEHEKSGEFSYPAIIKSANGDFHITYTSNRKFIKHVVIRIH